MYKNSHWTLLVSLVLAGAAQAQPNLSLTVAESGNFQILPQGPNCSAVSPKYVNYPLLDPNTKLLINSVPGRCISIVQAFVRNTGTVASGPFSVTDIMQENEPMGATILNGGLSGGLHFTSSNFSCDVVPRFMNAVTCQHAGLAAGAYDVVTIQVLLEDFFDTIHPAPGGARVGLNNRASIDLQGGADSDPTDNQRFDSVVFRAPLMDGLSFNTMVPRVLLTVHSVPEGKTVKVDDVVITTPHTFAYENSSIFQLHTVDGSPLFSNFVAGIPTFFIVTNVNPFVYIGFVNPGNIDPNVFSYPTYQSITAVP